MCPSYMATRDEKDTTRARANMLRNALTRPLNDNPFDDEDLKEVLDLCLSCKGCKKECPSTVDMAKMKAEVQQQYYDANGSPWRSRLIARFAATQRFASRIPWAYNFVSQTPMLRRTLNRLCGFHPERTIPRLPSRSLDAFMSSRKPHPNAGSRGSVLFYMDEFTRFSDAGIAIKAVELLERLGYAVIAPRLRESGRTWLSKGFVRKARSLIEENARLLEGQVNESTPLIGIEPSAILTFRDEALDLARNEARSMVERIGPHCLMFDEFIAREAKTGRITADSFTRKAKKVYLHGHCFQKALASSQASVDTLSLPARYDVVEIPSGCCGMAGAFGYEREHYKLSMKVAELTLAPSIRAAEPEAIIAAPGTSCRHQIHDAAGRVALHPAEVLHAALV